MKVRQFFGLMLYKTIGQFLPSSSSPIKIGKHFRRFCGSLILLKHGKKINIERKANFSIRCEIGNNSSIGQNAFIGKTIIGENVMMGPDVKIYTINHSHSRIDVPMTSQGVDEEKPVIIEDDVWIGANVIILPGVVIGRGCIIGAGSVVTKSTPPYTICCGNPAIVKKERK